jgi:Cu(I)/Ag(I) efflux system membrane fusion protein
MKRTAVIVGATVCLLFLAFTVGRFSARHSAALQAPGRRVLYYVDPMHPAYRSDKPGTAPDCGMALEPVFEGESSLSQAPLQEGAVALTEQRQQLSGIRVATVSRSEGLRTIRTTGRVVPDDNNLYRIQAGFDGWIESLKENPPGTLVKRNQVLATLYSPDIRSAQVAYVGFMASVERLKQGMAQSDMRSVEDTERVNEEQLRLLGMGDVQIKQIAATHRATSSLDLVAPGDGIVLARGISPHQRFEKGTELYRIADLSKVWIVADAHGDESALLPGTRVKVNIPELDRTIEARMSTATPLFDEASRTLKLRMEADNPGLLMRPDMFVDVEFQAKLPPGLSIPAEAVLDSGLRKIVYVETSEGVFEPRPVTIAAAYGDRITVASGIKEGDRVVVSGNFLLDSESRMRSAGHSAPTTLPMPAMEAFKPPQANVAMQSKSHRATMPAELSDPVCGMTLKPEKVAFKETYQGKTFSFCSDSCHKKFLADPGKYASEKAARASVAEDQAAHSHD